MNEQDYFEQFRGDPCLPRIRIKPSWMPRGRLSIDLSNVVYMPVDEHGLVYLQGQILGSWSNVEFEHHNAFFPDNQEAARQHAPNPCIFEDD